ncbi:MAG: hypothetical protein LBE34_09055 [Flavobacteriaceae bacterium]|jgi:heat shock protein HslJ|nr:hypothetical protein [Flavobacteriaceae bacterium]
MILALTVSLFPSCGMDNSKDKGNKEGNNKHLELLNKSVADGTFFKAIAQDSLQTVTIGTAGIVYTSVKPNEKIIFPYVEPLIEGDSRVYKSAVNNYEIEIAIYEDETAKNSFDGRFDHSIAISLVKKVDNVETILDFACFGHYVYNTKLSGNWIFQSYEESRVEDLGINQIPMICIDVNTRSFSGSGGNHMIYGDFRCEGERIYFKIMLSPEYITDQFQKEKELLTVLDNCDQYMLEEDFLYLYSGGQLKLTFLRDNYNI